MFARWFDKRYRRQPLFSLALLLCLCKLCLLSPNADNNCSASIHSALCNISFTLTQKATAPLCTSLMSCLARSAQRFLVKSSKSVFTTLNSMLELVLFQFEPRMVRCLDLGKGWVTGHLRCSQWIAGVSLIKILRKLCESR